MYVYQNRKFTYEIDNLIKSVFAIYFIRMQLIFIISLDKIIRITKERTENYYRIEKLWSYNILFYTSLTFSVYFMVIFKNNFIIIFR